MHLLKERRYSSIQDFEKSLHAFLKSEVLDFGINAFEEMYLVRIVVYKISDGKKIIVDIMETTPSGLFTAKKTLYSSLRKTIKTYIEYSRLFGVEIVDIDYQ